jgi:hypothetical protein
MFGYLDTNSIIFRNVEISTQNNLFLVSKKNSGGGGGGGNRESFKIFQNVLFF